MFDTIHDLQELKRAYHVAARSAHPDMGGSTEEMQRINSEYEKAVKRIQREKAMGKTYTKASANSETETETETETAETMKQFQEVLNVLYSLDGLNIELCGSWLWISGNTYGHKDALKAAGCKWSANKKAWYWYSGDYHKHGKHSYTMDEIRDFHGSETLKAGKAPERIRKKPDYYSKKRKGVTT